MDREIDATNLADYLSKAFWNEIHLKEQINLLSEKFKYSQLKQEQYTQLLKD